MSGPVYPFPLFFFCWIRNGQLFQPSINLENIHKKISLKTNFLENAYRPPGPPWWTFFPKIVKNVLVYPQPTQIYVLWHLKWEKSIVGRRELNNFTMLRVVGCSCVDIFATVSSSSKRSPVTRNNNDVSYVCSHTRGLRTSPDLPINM